MPLDIDLESDSKNPSNFVLNDVFDTNVYKYLTDVSGAKKGVFFTP